MTNGASVATFVAAEWIAKEPVAQQARDGQPLNLARIRAAGALRLTACVWRWSYFNHYRATDNLVVLTTVDDGMILLPKRAVPDDRAMDEMKMLISEDIAKEKLLHTQKAFPIIVARGLEG